MVNADRIPHAACKACKRIVEVADCPVVMAGNACPPLRFRNPPKNGGKKPVVKMN